MYVIDISMIDGVLSLALDLQDNDTKVCFEGGVLQNNAKQSRFELASLCWMRINHLSKWQKYPEVRSKICVTEGGELAYRFTEVLSRAQRRVIMYTISGQTALHKGRFLITKGY
jgi:hypothetical protein